MDDQATQLLRRIERYRSYLREGLSTALAAIYLRQIADEGGVEEDRNRSAPPTVP